MCLWIAWINWVVKSSCVWSSRLEFALGKHCRVPFAFWTSYNSWLVGLKIWLIWLFLRCPIGWFRRAFIVKTVCIREILVLTSWNLVPSHVCRPNICRRPWVIGLSEGRLGKMPASYSAGVRSSWSTVRLNDRLKLQICWTSCMKDQFLKMWY